MKNRFIQTTKLIVGTTIGLTMLSNSNAMYQEAEAEMKAQISAREKVMPIYREAVKIEEARSEKSWEERQKTVQMINREMDAHVQRAVERERK